MMMFSKQDHRAGLGMTIVRVHVIEEGNASLNKFNINIKPFIDITD